MVIGLGGGGITSRAAAGFAVDRVGAWRVRRTGRLAGVFALAFVEDFAAGFVRAGVVERTVAAGRFATGALALVVARGDVGTTAGGVVTMAATGAVAEGVATVTGADWIGAAGAGPIVGTRPAAAVPPESGAGSPSSPSMNGLAMQS